MFKPTSSPTNLVPLSSADDDPDCIVVRHRHVPQRATSHTPSQSFVPPGNPHPESDSGDFDDFSGVCYLFILLGISSNGGNHQSPSPSVTDGDSSRLVDAANSESSTFPFIFSIFMLLYLRIGQTFRSRDPVGTTRDPDPRNMEDSAAGVPRTQAANYRDPIVGLQYVYRINDNSRH